MVGNGGLLHYCPARVGISTLHVVFLGVAGSRVTVLFPSVFDYSREVIVLKCPVFLGCPLPDPLA